MTTSNSVEVYKGSGKYWRRHIRKHGYDVTTEVLLETESHEELKETGVFFSKLWGVVKSSEWANCKLEEGEGGWSHVNVLEPLKGWKSNSMVIVPTKVKLSYHSFTPGYL
jgi:hypothetical protein